MKKEQVDKMSLQEAADYAIGKLVEQGERCVTVTDFSELCQYSNDKGHHCAIGWLLDEDNKKLMGNEGSLSYIIDEFPKEIPNLIKNNLNFFKCFQNFHDMSFFSDNISSGKEMGTLSDILKYLGNHIDVETNPNYKKWMELNFV